MGWQNGRFRQLKKDWDRHIMIGFVMALWILPNVLSKQEDAIDQEDFDGDMTDPEQMKKMMAVWQEKTKIIFMNQPVIKQFIQGMCLDMVKRGVFKVET